MLRRGRAPSPTVGQTPAAQGEAAPCLPCLPADLPPALLPSPPRLGAGGQGDEVGRRGEGGQCGAELGAALPGQDSPGGSGAARHGPPAPRRHRRTARPCLLGTNAPFPSATKAVLRGKAAPSGRPRLVYYFPSPPLALQAAPPPAAPLSLLPTAVAIWRGGTVRPARVPLRVTGAEVTAGGLPPGAVPPGPACAAVGSRLTAARREEPAQPRLSSPPPLHTPLKGPPAASGAGAALAARGSVRCRRLRAALSLKKRRQLLPLFRPLDWLYRGFPSTDSSLSYRLNDFEHRQTVWEVWIVVHPSMSSLFPTIYLPRSAPRNSVATPGFLIKTKLILSIPLPNTFSSLEKLPAAAPALAQLLGELPVPAARAREKRLPEGNRASTLDPDCQRDTRTPYGDHGLLVREGPVENCLYLKQ